MAQFKKFTTRDAEDIALMIEKIIKNCIDLDGRAFITTHDTNTSRTVICIHYNELEDECIKYVYKYETILSIVDLHTVIDDVKRAVKAGRRLMLDLYDEDLDDIDVITRAIKRGNEYEF